MCKKKLEAPEALEQSIPVYLVGTGLGFPSLDAQGCQSLALTLPCKESMKVFGLGLDHEAEVLGFGPGKRRFPWILKLDLVNRPLPDDCCLVPSSHNSRSHFRMFTARDKGTNGSSKLYKTARLIT